MTAVAGMLVVLAPEASADESWGGDPKRTAAAEALFQEARNLMKEGDFAKACPTLEEVTRLEPRAVGAKVKLAECYEAAGRLASAHATYLVAAALARSAGQPDREAWASNEATKLGPRVSRLTIEVGGANADVEDLIVERDGVDVGRAQWGVAVPVDGGEIVVTARAPGYVSAVVRVEVGVEKDSQRIVVPELAREIAEVEPPPTEPARPPGTPPLRPPEALAPASDEGIAPWVWIVGATGLASGLVGVGFRIDGAIVEAEQTDACGAARDACPASFDVEGTNDRKELDFQLFVGFGVVGVAALGVAVVGAIIDATTSSTTSGKSSSTVSLWVDSRADATVYGLGFELE